MHVAVWAEAVRNVWMMRQNRPSQVLPARDKSYTLRCCHCWIQEFDLECNVISDLGLRHLISSFLCKSILKCRATAIALLVQDDLPFTGFEECFQEVDVKPPIHIIKFGGNLRPAPSGATTVHICQADPLTAHDCCAAASKNSEAKSAQACSLQLAHLLFCVFNFISGQYFVGFAGNPQYHSDHEATTSTTSIVLIPHKEYLVSSSQMISFWFCPT
jgi:hypothetical protein